MLDKETLLKVETLTEAQKDTIRTLNEIYYWTINLRKVAEEEKLGSRNSSGDISAEILEDFSRHLIQQAFIVLVKENNLHAFCCPFPNDPRVNRVNEMIVFLLQNDDQPKINQGEVVFIPTKFHGLWIRQCPNQSMDGDEDPQFSYQMVGRNHLPQQPDNT